MPPPGVPLEQLGILTIGPFDATDPAAGHEPTLRVVTEVAFALPFTFEEADHVQLRTDIAGHLGPALGWHPTHA